uniref:Methylated-DNA--protein-cysteine methyltransferase n=1 Tax=Sinocyclocheilus rhinocerous TaxID=307959 RepID=A0A673HG63_9TELE
MRSIISSPVLKSDVSERNGSRFSVLVIRKPMQPVLDSRTRTAPAVGVPELQHCVDWLQCYFMKPESVSALPLPTLHNPLMQSDSFKAHVLWTLFKEVGLGKTVSYKLLADMIGNPKAVRAVGSAMKNNPIPLIVPCHRVLHSSGGSGSYMGGKGDDIKVWLLTHEKKHWSSMHQRDEGGASLGRSPQSVV